MFYFYAIYILRWYKIVPKTFYSMCFLLVCLESITWVTGNVQLHIIEKADSSVSLDFIIYSLHRIDFILKIF
jgi:hypothetical protein